jgi:hypothetical protein
MDDFRAGDFENDENRGDHLVAAVFLGQADCRLQLEDSDHAFQIWTCVVPCPEPPAVPELRDANSASR